MFDGYTTLKKERAPPHKFKLNQTGLSKIGNISIKEEKHSAKSHYDMSKIKSKYLSHIKETRYPTPKRYNVYETNDSKCCYTTDKADKEAKSTNLIYYSSSTHSSEVVSNSRISRNNFITPLIKQIEKKESEIREIKEKEIEYTRKNEKASNIESGAACVTIYTRFTGTMFPKIKDTPTLMRKRKSFEKTPESKKGMMKKAITGVYIPPKVLDFHPYLGLTPEILNINS